jgi:nucleoside-diphosphate-sugar epimerase
MYDGNNLSNMTESMPLNPPSEKGKIRKQIVDLLFDAIEHKGLKALVARSADFYGPGIKQTSMLTETVIKSLSTGSKANWLMGDGYKHSFTYTLDAGKACAILGNSTEAYGEVWHLPTATKVQSGWKRLCAFFRFVYSRHA